ncbi:RNase H family protein [Lysinibacter cavernae]|uniref:Ribonuclease H n=1 Tax=Lysinibacter cavernae TaxID=1640652 RepID=A0A7X5TV75_9MICO|nr:RNase H family protein [Lysinibacter cavernae]NIH54532.1 ribonuclease HI [Lysinibacter cavernae]
MSIRVAADGSALGNPGPAGWAWYVDDNCWGAGGWKHATNNQAELKAVLEFLRATKHLDDDLLILCDSQYVIKCLTEWMPGWKRKGWRKADGKPVLNVDLLKELDDELKGRTYRFEWVKGHANHPLNEAADERARAVSEAYQRGSAIPEGPGWTRDGSSTSSAAGSAAASAAPKAAAASKPVFQPEPTVDEQPGLFSFDDDSVSAASHPVTISLTDDEFARLAARAHATGMSPEDTLRSLI